MRTKSQDEWVLVLLDGDNCSIFLKHLDSEHKIEQLKRRLAADRQIIDIIFFFTDCGSKPQCLRDHTRCQQLKKWGITIELLPGEQISESENSLAHIKGYKDRAIFDYIIKQRIDDFDTVIAITNDGHFSQIPRLLEPHGKKFEAASAIRLQPSKLLVQLPHFHTLDRFLPLPNAAT